MKLLAAKLMAVVAIVIFIVLKVSRVLGLPVYIWVDPFLLGFICLLFSGGAAYIFASSKKRPRIRVVAMVLGVLGGVWAALFVPLPPFRPPDALYQMVGGILASLMAIGGGVLALERPRVGGILMLLGAIVGKIAVFYFHIIFLFLGGALALAPDKKRPAVMYVAMTLGIIGGLFAVYCALMGIVLRQPTIFPKEMDMLALWIWVFLFPGMGLLGGMLVLARPKVTGIFMLISGIIGPVGFTALGLLDGFFELVICALASFPLIIAGTIACIKR